MKIGVPILTGKMIQENLQSPVSDYCPAVQVCRTVPAVDFFGVPEKLVYHACHIHNRTAPSGNLQRSRLSALPTCAMTSSK